MSVAAFKKYNDAVPFGFVTNMKRGQQREYFPSFI
jgi:hypothetical protein